MTRFFSACATAVLFVLIWAPISSATNRNAPVVDGDELLVGLRPGTSNAALDRILGEEGASRVEQLRSLRVHRVRAPRGGAEQLKERLEKRNEVEFVEPNSLVTPDAVPNDPEYPNEWHLPFIGLPAAWNTTTGSSQVIIAILDSGVAAGHEDLQGKVLAGWNLYDNNADTSDVFGHGTMVAGTAAASSNNGIGVTGVSWSSRILPVRITLPDGNAYLSTIASGLTWAVDHGARVMNVSFSSVAGSQTIRSAAQYVQSKGGVVVASAGNCSCDDPTAENPYIISVGATDAVDAVKTFSSRGAYVDLSAPGVMIKTTAREGDYVYIAGTSFSSPIVAGVVALMMAANPSATPLEIEAWLEDTAKDIGSPGYDTASGFGRVRADLAVAAAAAGAPPPADVTPPAASIQSPAAGATLAGVATVEVLAFDDRAVARVELYADGGLVATDGLVPFSFAWDTRSLTNGSHTLVAVAVDAAGNRGSSSPVGLLTANLGDQVPPLVLVTSPVAGSTLTRYVDIKSTATDETALARVDVLVDGTVIGGSNCAGTTCSISVRWNTRKATKGVHEIRAQASDLAGHRTTSVPVQVTVR